MLSIAKKEISIKTFKEKKGNVTPPVPVTKVRVKKVKKDSTTSENISVSSVNTKKKKLQRPILKNKSSSLATNGETMSVTSSTLPKQKVRKRKVSSKQKAKEEPKQKNDEKLTTKTNNITIGKKDSKVGIEVIKKSTTTKKKKRNSKTTPQNNSEIIQKKITTEKEKEEKLSVEKKKSIVELASLLNDSNILPVEKQSGIFEEFKEGQELKHNVGGRSVYRHRSSICLYRDGYGPGHGLEEQPVITKNGRPVFHLPLNLNDSTASFLGNSRNNAGGGCLEMSSGLLAFHPPKSKYDFKISLDETNEMSQTAAMLKDYIFDDNNVWNSDRTEPTHLKQKGQEEKKHEQQDDNKPPILNLPPSSRFDITEESIDRDLSFIIPSTQTTNRSFLYNEGRTSTRLSFLFNKNTGLLCKNCFSTNCMHMEKFSLLASPKVKKIIKNSETIETNSSDISQIDNSYRSNSNDTQDTYWDNIIDNNPESIKDLKNNLLSVEQNETNNGSESLRLLEVQEFNHLDPLGNTIEFQELKMELDVKFETSTPNGEETFQGGLGKALDLSESMLRYTPAIMNKEDSGLKITSTSGYSRQTSIDTLQYDSDYDDASYLNACKGSANSTFEQLDITSGITFSNSENNSVEDVSDVSLDTVNTLDNRRNNAKGSKQKVKRKISLQVIPDLDTVFEGEESSARSAPPSAVIGNSFITGLEELLETVEDNLTNRTNDSVITVDSAESTESSSFNNKDKSQYDFDKSDSKNKKEYENENENDNNEDGNENKSDMEQMFRDSLDEGDNDNITENDNDNVNNINHNALYHENNIKENNEAPNKTKFSTESNSINLIEPNIIEFKQVNSEQATIQEKEKKEREETPERSFRRIQENEEEEEIEEYVQQLNDDELQLWLQENRKYCFEKDFFYDKIQYNNNDEDEDDDKSLLPEDKEVLEINTPEWEKKLRKSLSVEEKEDDIPAESSILVHSNFTETPLNSNPGTGSSSNQPTTQGSYRHVDILVINRNNRNEVNQNLQELDTESHHSDGGDSVIDSGVHSSNTVNSGRTLSNDEIEILPAHSEIVIHDDRLQNEENIHEERNSYTHSKLHTSSTNMEPLTLSSSTISSTEPLNLPLIDNNAVQKINNYEEPHKVGSQNKESRKHNITYYDTSREITSPMLEHHKKMARYHRERIALLTPLLHGVDNNISELHKPKPPPLSVQLKTTFKRKFSKNIDMNSPSSNNYVDNLNNISPRTRPFVPHPPSYDRSKHIIRQPNNYYQQQTPPLQRQHMYNSYYEEPAEHYGHILSKQNSKWYPNNNNKRPLRRQIATNFTKAVDTKHDMALYLTVPFRSMNLRRQPNNTYNENGRPSL